MRNGQHTSLIYIKLQDWEYMSLVDWAATLAGFAAFGATIIAATSWVLKSYLKNFMHELKPNGGNSMKDSLNRIGSDVTEMRVSLARLEGRFDQHVDELPNS